MRSIYPNWKKSKTLYEIFLAVVSSEEKLTITSLALKLRKDRKLVSEQVQTLVEHNLLKSTKEGKYAIITLEESWKEKYLPNVKQIQDVYTFIAKFRNFEQLYAELKEYKDFSIVESGVSFSSLKELTEILLKSKKQGKFP